MGAATTLMRAPKTASDVVAKTVVSGLTTVMMWLRAVVKWLKRLALGAQAGHARLADIFAKAGFKRFQRATETPFNLVLEARL